MVYVLAFGAAALFGLGSAVQQRAAARAPAGSVLHWRLLWYLVRQRMWLLGLGTSVAGNILSGTALGVGSVALVQPLLVTRLMFALPVAAAWERRLLTRREWAGAVAVAAGLGTFLFAGRPEGDRPAGPPIWMWLLIAGVVGLLTGVLVWLARRLRPRQEAPVLGAGAGMLFGLQSALTHTAVQRLFALGAMALLLNWTVYAVVGVALAATLLTQSAFRLEPLEVSYPPLAAAEPLTGIAIGVEVLGSGLRFTPLLVAVEVAGLIIMTAGVWILAASANVAERAAGTSARAETAGIGIRTHTGGDPADATDAGGTDSDGDQAA